MDFQKLSMRILPCLMALLFPSFSAAGNAIGGTVRDGSKNDPIPIEGVAVTVTQDNNAKTETRKDDGAFVLNVHEKHKTIDIVFSKDGYTNAFDFGVENTKESQTRPVVYMAAKGDLKMVPKKILESIINNTFEASKKAKGNKLIEEAVKDNLVQFSKLDNSLLSEGAISGIKKIRKEIDP